MAKHHQKLRPTTLGNNNRDALPDALQKRGKYRTGQFSKHPPLDIQAGIHLQRKKLPLLFPVQTLLCIPIHFLLPYRGIYPSQITLNLYSPTTLEERGELLEGDTYGNGFSVVILQRSRGEIILIAYNLVALKRTVKIIPVFII